MSTPTNARLDELDAWLIAAVDAGYSLAAGLAPLPLADAGLERRIARAVALWRERRGVKEVEVVRPAWLEELIGPEGARDVAYE
jgi:hypothetical protein